jgi:nickel-type superoxide dismutase maturation protease
VAALPIWPLLTVRVVETSMQPALRPGDRLLVLRWPRPRSGDIVVVRDPEYPKRLLVKRLTERTPHGDYVLRADNPNVGRDSRDFGALPPRLMVGKVVWRYGTR